MTTDESIAANATGNIAERTAQYVAAFDRRDLDAVGAMMDDAFVLTDPEVTGLTPRAAVLDYIGGIFERSSDLSFVARTIVADGDVSVIEFELTIDDAAYRGVDVIEWNGERMAAMRAYLGPA